MYPGASERKDKSMKWIAKPILWLFTSAIPVFIAACYGCPNGDCGGIPYSQDGDGNTDYSNIEGIVIDQDSQEGIADIKVSCVFYDAYNSEEIDSFTYTAAGDGAFKLRYDTLDECDALRFQDLDGLENGRQYKTEEIDFDTEELEDLVIEMTPVD